MNLGDLTGRVEKPFAAVCVRNRASSMFEDSSAPKGDESNSSAMNFDDRCVGHGAVPGSGAH